MDRALLRPGRFGKLLYVPLPSPDDRVLILKALARNKHFDSSVDLSAIGRMEACENLSGADLAELVCIYTFSLYFCNYLCSIRKNGK
jgi:ribosome biogenesis ATPase